MPLPVDPWKHVPNPLKLASFGSGFDFQPVLAGEAIEHQGEHGAGHAVVGHPERFAGEREIPAAQAGGRLAAGNSVRLVLHERFVS